MRCSSSVMATPHLPARVPLQFILQYVPFSLCLCAIDAPSADSDDSGGLPDEPAVFTGERKRASVFQGLQTELLKETKDECSGRKHQADTFLLVGFSPGGPGGPPTI